MRFGLHVPGLFCSLSILKIFLLMGCAVAALGRVSHLRASPHPEVELTPGVAHTWKIQLMLSRRGQAGTSGERPAHAGATTPSMHACMPCCRSRSTGHTSPSALATTTSRLSAGVRQPPRLLTPRWVCGDVLVLGNVRFYRGRVLLLVGRRKAWWLLQCSYLQPLVREVVAGSMSPQSKEELLFGCELSTLTTVGSCAGDVYSSV